MTVPNENGTFYFSETLIDVEGKQNSLLPVDQSLSVLLYLPSRLAYKFAAASRSLT